MPGNSTSRDSLKKISLFSSPIKQAHVIMASPYISEEEKEKIQLRELEIASLETRLRKAQEEKQSPKPPHTSQPRMEHLDIQLSIQLSGQKTLLQKELEVIEKSAIARKREDDRQPETAEKERREKIKKRIDIATESKDCNYIYQEVAFAMVKRLLAPLHSKESPPQEVIGEVHFWLLRLPVGQAYAIKDMLSEQHPAWDKEFSRLEKEEREVRQALFEQKQEEEKKKEEEARKQAEKLNRIIRPYQEKAREQAFSYSSSSTLKPSR
jgi:hypothetical protein